jgi:hypothetical protein
MVFSQLLDFLPRYAFDVCVQRYHGNRRVRRFSCFDQFLCMAFAQLTVRESLRDIELCLRTMGPKLYHVGLRGSVSRSTLADANEQRDWRIFADFAHVLIGAARALYAEEDFGVELDSTVYAFDSTTIDLSLTLFPWARFRQEKAAIKAHTLLDLRGPIPCFICITEGKANDNRALPLLVPEAGSYYIMDRGYTNLHSLHEFHLAQAFFITRARENLAYRRRAYRPVDKSTGLRSDQAILLSGPKSSQRYPDPLRRIHYFDLETANDLIFVTNNFFLPALTVAQLYHCRWQIELFFKWLKQHLRIKAFYGTSLNAVKTQLWIAVSVYVLVAIMKKELRIDRSLNEILQIAGIALFEKAPLAQALTTGLPQTENAARRNQLQLFNF